MWLILGPAAWVSWIPHFSGPAAQHLRRSSGLLRGSPGFLISPGLLRSICVDVAGLRLKDVAAWVSWISSGLLRSIFVWYIVCGRYCEVSVFLLVEAIWSVVEI